jgi:phenylpropionate dioxygenase-like ring-hydroxylating dioxygenase large terminal subunit
MMIGTDLDDGRATLQQKLQREEETAGNAIASYFYQSPRVYALELSHLLYRSWVYAAHVSEIPQPGDFKLFEMGADSFIICRDQSGEVHALINVCRHRGARVCEQRTGNCSTFVCPYHGWVYNTDGSLRAAREMHALEGFEPEKLGLKRASIAVFHGLIFINCNPEAPPFIPVLAAIEKPLGAYRLGEAKIAHQQTYRVEANWKLCLENYLECYHCATSHRAYARMHTLKEPAHKVQSIVDAMLTRTEDVTGVTGIGDEWYKLYGNAEHFGACVSHQRYGLFEGVKTGSEDGQPVAPLMGNIRGYDGGVGDFQMGPLSFMLNYPDHCVLYRFVPRGPTSTDMHVAWFVNGDAVEGRDYHTDKLIWLWDRTTKEDEYIISRNSAGVNSQFFEPGPYHPEFEEGLKGFTDWYLDILRSTL